MEERFWAKVRKGDGCWEWTATTVGAGYGRFYPTKNFGWLAHRLSWHMHNGPVPPGMHVLHRCDNPRCVNPAHLFLGTHAQNMADMAAKGRAADNRGDKSVVRVLSEYHVRLIRARVAAGEVQRRLAEEYHVAETTISAVMRRQNWAHVS